MQVSTIILTINHLKLCVMKRSIILFVSLFMAASMITSCAKDAMEPQVDGAVVPTTRAYGDKTPKVMAYIEVNDTNPLNTMLYRMNGEPFIDIVTIFAANIRANGTEPQLWLNDNVSKILVPDAGSTSTGHYKYVQPLRQDGAKVLLSILGDHQGVGVGNLTDTNQQKFAEILAWAVEEYDLDGIDFDDEWAKYGENPSFPSMVSGSFSGLILKLRAELDERFPNEHKLITVFDIGYASSLTSEAVAACDYGWYAYFSPNAYVYPSSPWTNAKWSAQAVDLDYDYNILELAQIKNRSQQSSEDGMGAIMTYDLRIHTEEDPLPALQKIGEGAFSGSVTRSGTAYTKDWTATTGTAINYDDID